MRTPVRPEGRRLVAIAVTIVVAFGVVPPAVAQEVGEEAPATAGLRLQDGDLPLVDEANPATELTVWPSGRLAYQSTGVPAAVASGQSQDGAPLPGVFRGETGLAAVDLDTFEEVARTDPAETPRMARPSSGQFVAVDHAGGRLFVPHSNANDDPLVNSARCPLDCFAGLYVLDATDLRKIREIPFDAIGLETGSESAGVVLVPLNVTYSPPITADGSGKVHVLLAETVAFATSLLGGPSSLDPSTRTRFQWVVQIDPGSGTVDWVTRIDACTGREGDTSTGNERHRGTVFRSTDPARPTVWVGCLGAGVNTAWVVELELDPDDPDGQPTAQRRYPGPAGALTFRADVPAEKLVIKSVVNDETWWVFDGRVRSFVAKLGVGPFRAKQSIAGLDPATGRLYVLAPGDDGGMFYADIRRQQVPQFVRLPSFSALVTRPNNNAGESNALPLAVDPAGEHGPTRVFVRPAGAFNTDPAPDHFLVVADTVPVSVDVRQPPDDVDRTVDVPEDPSSTTAAYSGQARGYGLRTIFVGGLDAALNTPVDHDRAIKHGARVRNPCTDRTRTFAFGLAGSDAADRGSRIDQFGAATAQARALYVDPRTRADLEASSSSCSTPPVPTWEEVQELLPMRPVDEPSLFLALIDARESECAAPDKPSESHEGGTDVVANLRSSVACSSGERVTSASAARAVSAGPVRVGDASSTFDVVREDDGGIRSIVTSWVRDLSIVGDQGSVRIGLVEATAESWATGREQAPGTDEAGDGCDRSRTAGTCLSRTISRAVITDASGATVFSCGQCETDDNQRALVSGMQTVLGSSWAVRLRDPDPDLAEGSSDGYQAAVQKSAVEQFADRFLSHDLLPTLPALELIRINNGTATPGRQVYQFAGIEAASTYGITCLLVVQDGQCTAEAASLRIELEDTDGQALQGGVFEVQADADGDGTISLEESTTPARTCVTAGDGSCELDPIAAGSYVVRQTLAPAGFAPAPATSVTLPPGGQGLIEVVNGRLATTGLRIGLTDTADPPQPLAGGTFEVHADDGDSTLGGGDVLLATCTTGATGACPFELAIADSVLTGTRLADGDPRLLIVPAGPFVIHQSAAPDGYAPVDDVAFTLPEGQIADATFQNGPSQEAAPTETPTQPSPTPTEGTEETVAGDAPVEPPPPVADAPVEQPVAIAPPAPAPPPVVTVNVPEVPARTPAVAPPAQQPSTVVRVLQAPAAAARLLLRSPLEAAAFGGVLLLFAAAAAGAWRRRLLFDLLSD